MQHGQALSFLQEGHFCWDGSFITYLIVFLSFYLYSFLCHFHLYPLRETLTNPRVEGATNDTQRRYKIDGFTLIS